MNFDYLHPNALSSAISYGKIPFLLWFLNYTISLAGELETAKMCSHVSVLISKVAGITYNSAHSIENYSYIYNINTSYHQPTQ